MRLIEVEFLLMKTGEACDAPGVVVGFVPPVPKVVKKRVRKPRPPVQIGRIPLPRGVLSWARRQGFGKVPPE